MTPLLTNDSLAGRDQTAASGMTDHPKYRDESACIRTRRNYDPDPTMFQFTFGYIEARCRMPRHVRSDYWAAFWLLAGNMLSGDDDDTRNGSEIDIFESFDLWNAGSMKHTIHWGGYDGTHNASGQTSGPRLELLDDQFHTYAPWCGPTHLWEQELPEQDTFEVDYVRVYSLPAGKTGNPHPQKPVQPSPGGARPGH